MMSWEKTWRYWEEDGFTEDGEKFETLNFVTKNGEKSFQVEVYEGGETKIFNNITGKYVYEGKYWTSALKKLKVPTSLINYSEN